MAVQSLCAKLVNGLDGSCISPVRKYYQQAVLINKTDIESYTVSLPDAETGTCDYKTTITLKEGTTGYRITGAEAGSSFYGSFSKSRSDLGYPQYIHNTGILITGASEEAKCILDSLDKGSFVVALQLKDDTVEIYGLVNGLNSGDYEYNLQDGGGGTQIILSSLEDAPEANIPLIYESDTPGNETIDFDAAFENPAP